MRLAAAALMLAAFLSVGGSAAAAEEGSVVLPWVPNGDDTGEIGTWDAQIVLQNPAYALCGITIQVPPGNNSWMQSDQFLIEPHGSLVFTPDDIALPEPGGPVMIDSTGCDVAVAVKQTAGDVADAPWSHGANAVAGYTGVPGADLTGMDTWFLPIVQTNNGWNSYIRVSNLLQSGDETVTVDLFPMRNDAGEGAKTSVTFGLAPGTTKVIDVLETVGQTEWVGFARVTSNGAFAAIVQREKPETSMVMLNVGSPHTSAAGSSGSHRLDAPIVFNAYNGWNTGINVANTTDQPANVTISYPGAARPDDHLTLAPFSSDYVFTPANAPEQTGFSGTAVITADQPVAAVVDEVKYGTGEAISYSASGVAASELTVPLVFRQDEDGVHNDNSGVNLSNPNDHDVTVEIQILDELGVPVGGTITVNLPANQGNFAYLPSTAVPPGTRGAALIHTTDGSPVVAISNDVSYDVAADGSAVFAAVSGSGFYRVGDAAMALP